MLGSKIGRLGRLPQLDQGMNLLRNKTGEKFGIQSLAINQMISNNKTVYWVDSKEKASLTTLNNLIPNSSILERIKVARSFTAYQHYSLIQELKNKVSYTTSLIVIPEINWFYRDMVNGEKLRMIKEEINILMNISNHYDIPVLWSLYENGDDSVKELIRRVSDEEIEFEVTEMGPKFSSSNFKTYFYSVNGYFQTTIDFWRAILKQAYKRKRGGSIEWEEQTKHTETRLKT